MCIICLALDKETITIDEADKHLDEIRNILEPEHEIDVATRIWELSREEPNWQYADDVDGDIVWNFDPLDSPID